MNSGLFTISTGELTARIDPVGAELCSLTDAAGREYMTDADPRWWTGHAPILFPIVGALRDNRYRLDGQDYPLGKHGFARHSRFICEDHEAAGRVRFRLSDTDESRAAYPFRFELGIVFQVEALTLAITATVINRDTVELPFSFGFHPAFAWPLPGDAPKQAHQVIFAHEEPQPIRRIDPASGLLLPTHYPTPVRGRVLVPDADLFAPDALIWDRLHSQSCRFGAPGGAQVALSFPDTAMLGIWQKPGAPFLCIEPWQGMADPVGYEGDFRDKPGIVKLAAGASRSFRLAITITPPQGETS